MALLFQPYIDISISRPSPHFQINKDSEGDTVFDVSYDVLLSEAVVNLDRDTRLIDLQCVGAHQDFTFMTLYIRFSSPPSDAEFEVDSVIYGSDKWGCMQQTSSDHSSPILISHKINAKNVTWSSPDFAVLRLQVQSVPFLDLFDRSDIMIETISTETTSQEVQSAEESPSQAEQKTTAYIDIEFIPNVIAGNRFCLFWSYQGLPSTSTVQILVREFKYLYTDVNHQIISSFPISSGVCFDMYDAEITNAYIQVTSNYNPQISAASNYFDIVDEIAVYAPKYMSNYTPTSSVTVSWTNDGVYRDILYLYLYDYATEDFTFIASLSTTATSYTVSLANIGVEAQTEPYSFKLLSCNTLFGYCVSNNYYESPRFLVPLVMTYGHSDNYYVNDAICSSTSNPDFVSSLCQKGVTMNMAISLTASLTISLTYSRFWIVRYYDLIPRVDIQGNGNMNFAFAINANIVAAYDKQITFSSTEIPLVWAVLLSLSATFSPVLTVTLDAVATVAQSRVVTGPYSYRVLQGYNVDSPIQTFDMPPPQATNDDPSFSAHGQLTFTLDLGVTLDAEFISFAGYSMASMALSTSPYVRLSLAAQYPAFAPSTASPLLSFGSCNLNHYIEIDLYVGIHNTINDIGRFLDPNNI
jgi:hypothetical protein